ncbi:hypothetical protein I5907_16855 [Panacibacter sp. DH6]|uniref:Histidine kinase domain-containing protein n=1 Tax=Panacibacter microcysteis TaxID=2793269 RepID=A0A931GYX7_9BACT|nr:sensor histidine kinase [Panacibacter microcysteis]MBG9377913.1 hypothetical protein [Panacibacter microcysteis]
MLRKKHFYTLHTFVCKAVFTTVLSLCLQSIFAQPSKPVFEIITAAEGLSHNKVQCILQDHQGYIWFGTVYGLNRYDGYTFRTFENTPGDTASLANNNIVSLFQDSKHIIWIGSSTGLSSYNPVTNKFTNYNFPLLQGYVYDFFEDADRTLWLAGSNGLFSLDQYRRQITRHPTDNNGRENIQGIVPDQQNKNILWLSTETGFRKYNMQSGKTVSYPVGVTAFEDISKEITHNIIQTPDGNLWMSTTNNGIYKLDVNSGQVSGKVISGPAGNAKTATCLSLSSDSTLWVGSEGLYRYNYRKDLFTYVNPLQEENPNAATRVRSIQADKNGILWVGTERGIAIYDPKLYGFTTAKAEYPFTLQSANTIIEDKTGNFWVGNYVGLGTVDITSGIYTNRNNLIGQGVAIYTGVRAPDGSIWFGADNGLIHLFSHNNEWKTEKFAIDGQRKIQVRALAFYNNEIWTGTNGAGLYVFDCINKSFTPFKTVAPDAKNAASLSIAAITVLSADSLLIGTKGKGVLLVLRNAKKVQKIEFVKQQEISAIDNAIINAIYEDKKKHLWIGTDGGGLWKTDATLNNFFNYSIKNGLQSTSISQITEDDKGQVWLNTSLGLEVIDPDHNRFVHYSAKDGLSINQQDYLVKKSNGDLVRVDFNGLHTFHSSTINLNKEVPPVYITQMQVMDKTIHVYQDTVIHLRYGENYISFTYVALNFTQSFKNRYAYMLDGLDKKWVEAGDRRFATYANIAPGTYTFHVKAANNNGIWNEGGAKITFIISQPWWNTWWFYTVVILSIVAIVYIIFQAKLRQKVKAIEVRNTISRDLHDEVGSTLSSIGFLSSMALNDAEEANSRIVSTLTTINESSTRMLDAMNDIIWNIQPKNDTVQNIIARMVAFASDLLESRKINLHLQTGKSLENLHLGITERHNFYMIFKEAINNLAKYSQATEAWINMDYTDGYLTLEIKDNGKGFDPGHIRDGGNGLRNMKSRAEKIGAYYRLETEANTGTTVVVQLKPSKD